MQAHLAQDFDGATPCRQVAVVEGCDGVLGTDDAVCIASKREAKPLNLQGVDGGVHAVPNPLEVEALDQLVVVVALRSADLGAVLVDLVLDLAQPRFVGMGEEVLKIGKPKPPSNDLDDEGVDLLTCAHDMASAAIPLPVGLDRLVADPAQVEAGAKVLAVGADSIGDSARVIEPVLHGLPDIDIHDPIPEAEDWLAVLITHDLGTPRPAAIAIRERLLRRVGAVPGVARVAQDSQNGRRRPRAVVGYWAGMQALVGPTLVALERQGPVVCGGGSVGTSGTSSPSAPDRAAAIARSEAPEAKDA